MPYRRARRVSKLRPRRRNVKRVNRSRVGVGRVSYRKTARIVRNVMSRMSESKYVDMTWALAWAANNATTSTDGHALYGFTMPAQGTGVNSRVGNKICVTGFVMNFRINQSPTTSTAVNTPITGRIYLLCYKSGGATPPIAEFMKKDPNLDSYTYNSLRNTENYKDFVVLRSKRVYLGMDSYANNYGQYSMQWRWKGRQSVTFPSASQVPATNCLALLFVADSGFLSNTVNPQNFLYVSGESRMYFKDD